jgi:nucleoside-diphosphate-sugar epimerase
MPRRVLVTGGAGFVGVHLLRGLAAAGWDVVATARRAPDALTSAFLAPVADRVAWLQGDVNDATWLTAQVAEQRLDAVVHAAAVTPTAEVERDATRLVIDTNLTATVTVLDAVRAHGVPRLLVASSTGVYAGAGDALASRHAPRREDEVLEPRNLYAVCKLASERLLDAYSEIHGLRAASLRIGSVYGPMERATRSRSGLSLVAGLVAAAAHGRHLRVSHPEVGRDLIHAHDAAAAVIALLDAPSWRWTLYNLASPVAHPLREVLDLLAADSGLTWEASAVEDADLALTPDRHRDAVDLSRLAADAGFAPRVPLAEGLAHTLAWRRLGDDPDPAAVAAFPAAPA